MDIAIQWNIAAAEGDWVVSGGDIGMTGGLLSAVLIALFTDRLASVDYINPDPNAIPDSRGWWADTFEPNLIGSRLWQLNRAKKTPRLLSQAYDYCVECLQTFVDQGVASRIEVNTYWATADTIGIFVQLWPPSGGVAQEFRFSWAWGGV